MALRIPPPQRTQGDGMEKTEASKVVEHTVLLAPKPLESNENQFEFDETNVDRRVTLDQNKLNSRVALHKAMGTMMHLTPHTLPKKKDHNVLINLKNKEPKFVPYEPYKAAVKPIIPNDPKSKKHSKRKVSFVAQLQKELNPETTVPNKEIKVNIQASEPVQGNWAVQKEALENELQTLKEENEQLENQLKFQAQVNGELKNLLVAAVGEDMEIKVHGLTEDKLHLAHALLNSANSLTTHQEQTEWLAGQCEVWRSKFLASSVMVEDLARWKASLCHKVSEAQDVIKKLMEERKQVRDSLLKTYSNLCHLRESYDLVNKRSSLKTGNILDVALENLKISDILVVQLLGNLKEYSNKGTYGLPTLTHTERLAEHIVSNPHLLRLIGEPDEACNAVMGAAVALSGQLYLKNHPPKIECCPQCSGEIKLV